MVTKYVLVEKRRVKGKLKDFAILETYQMADVVTTLAELLKEKNDS